ncbi:MAG TPA: Holliday junction resolvase RuvX [Candidatus Dormibacteraeota bacterium]|nr:Holliday junction resolvase RuvX [Candidatus Dormibacteraeota bacterium]
MLAVDPGSRRVGLAVSDPTATIAQPLATLDAEPRETLAERLAEAARHNEVKRIVVGLPRQLDGSIGDAARSARDLAGELRKASRLPVELVDERLTTALAERSMIAGGVRRSRRRATIDQVAATLLLQSHLDSKHV